MGPVVEALVHLSEGSFSEEFASLDLFELLLALGYLSTVAVPDTLLTVQVRDVELTRDGLVI